MINKMYQIYFLYKNHLDYIFKERVSFLNKIIHKTLSLSFIRNSFSLITYWFAKHRQNPTKKVKI